jgi:hypothetical protein
MEIGRSEYVSWIPENGNFAVWMENDDVIVDEEIGVVVIFVFSGDEYFATVGQ